MRARIRTIKPEALAHDGLWDLAQATGLPIFQGFVGLWCFADREGRFEWRPRMLKPGILPHWDGDFEDLLDALERGGFVRSYEVDGKRYGCIPSFRRHQSPNAREPQSDIPEPPGEPLAAGHADTPPDTDAHVHAHADTPPDTDAHVHAHADTPPDTCAHPGKGMGRELEGKGMGTGTEVALDVERPPDLTIPPETIQSLEVAIPGLNAAFVAKSLTLWMLKSAPEKRMTRSSWVNYALSVVRGDWSDPRKRHEIQAHLEAERDVGNAEADAAAAETREADYRRRQAAHGARRLEEMGIIAKRGVIESP